MRNPLKPKLFFILSTIFFFTSIASQANNIYSISETYKNKDMGIKSENVTDMDEEKKILGLTSTMDEALEYLKNDNISYEIKKQLLNDLIDSVNIISNKLSISDDIFVKELNKQHNSLTEKNNVNLEVLLKLYEEWKVNINYS